MTESRLAKATVLAAVSFAALCLTSNMASADGYKPYVSVFGGASFLNGIRGGHKSTYSTTTSTSDAARLITTQLGTFKTKTGYILGAAAGMRWNDMLRTEIELSHASNAADSFAYDGGGVGTFTSGSVEQTFLMGNVWLNLPTHTAFSPYIGGGIGVGWANATFDKLSFTQSSAGFAWQVGGGVIYDINDKIAIDAGYRYKVMNVNFTSSDPNWFISDKSLASHNVQIGLTVKF